MRDARVVQSTCNRYWRARAADSPASALASNVPPKCLSVAQDEGDPAATPRTPRERIGLTGNLASISMPGDSGAEVTPRPIEFSDSGSSDGGLPLLGSTPAHACS